MIALTAVAISLAPQWPWSFPVLFAQDNPTPTATGSITPSPTWTWTPTFTPFPGEVLTPTPTLTRSPRIVNEIVEPKPGDAVAGWLNITGTALIDAYRRYDMHIAIAGSEDWRWLTTSDAVVNDAVLYRLDTTQFADGFYDLRVRVLRDDGNYSETFLLNMEIRNANPPTPTPLRNELGTPLPPQPESPLMLVPTATPTTEPALVSNIPNGPGIFGPEHKQVLRGAIDVIGTANSSSANPFVRYELAITSSGREWWAQLYSSEEQFWQDVLYTLDTKRLDDGFYDLRLRLVFRDSNYDEYYVRNLRVANQTFVPDRRPTATPALGIFLPVSTASVSGVVEVSGVANTPNFLRWELYLAPSGTEQWSFLVGSQNPTAGLLARLDLSQIPFGVYDMRLRVINRDNQYQDYFSRQIQLAAPTPTFTPTLLSTVPITTVVTPSP